MNIEKEITEIKVFLESK